MLESSDLPYAKRQELAYFYLLNKEEQISHYRKELKLVKTELEHLRNSLVIREIERNEPQSPEKIELPPPKMQQPYGRFPQLAGPKPPVAANPSCPTMAKYEARQIVLSEVRRLGESLKQLQQHRDRLSAEIAQEVDRNVELDRANRTLSERVIELERSATLLRELLNQKIGSNGMLELAEAMHATGAGASILLNTIATRSESIDPAVTASVALAAKRRSDSNSGKSLSSAALQQQQAQPVNKLDPEYIDSNKYRNAISSAFFSRETKL